MFLKELKHTVGQFWLRFPSEESKLKEWRSHCAVWKASRSHNFANLKFASFISLLSRSGMRAIFNSGQQQAGWVESPFCISSLGCLLGLLVHFQWTIHIIMSCHLSWSQIKPKLVSFKLQGCGDYPAISLKLFNVFFLVMLARELTEDFISNIH